MPDRDHNLCFICASSGECAHREPDLRGWRSLQAWERRSEYLTITGRTEATAYRPVVERPSAVVTTPPEPEIAPIAPQRENGPAQPEALAQGGRLPAAGGKYRGSARYLET